MFSCHERALRAFRNCCRLSPQKYLTRTISSAIGDNSNNVNIEKSIKNSSKTTLPPGPSFQQFLKSQNPTQPPETEVVPYLQNAEVYGCQRRVYFDVYGCQMNVNDTEIIWSILKQNNFLKTNEVKEADVVLLVTCAIRESAETKIWHRLKELNAIRRKRRKGTMQMKIGILGCMAERLKHKILEKEKTVDVIAGPDSYKDLPRLLAITENNQTAVNVLLSLEETYADVMPVRLNEDSVTAFVSIMRGCDNMCTYCIVPFTRGRERSRPIKSILSEVEQLAKQGVKEITLLGQNVNSYRDLSNSVDAYVDTVDAKTKPTVLAKGFKTVYKAKIGGLRFADLLDKVAVVDPEVRIRFTSPHPKDFPDDVLEVIQARPNICKSLHMPAQSGNSAVLERMRRGYTREAYLDLISHIRRMLPGVYFSSDFICGFCDETEEEFQDTLTLMETVQFNVAYLFAYSMREKTTAHRRYKDNVPHDVKIERVQRMATVFRKHAELFNKSLIDKFELILVEGASKKSNEQLVGRIDGNLKVVIPKTEVPVAESNILKPIKAGDYVVVRICDANSQSLRGIPVYHTTLSSYCSKKANPYVKVNNEYMKYNSML